MLKRAKKLARIENRTMSELMREAYREYERKRRWERSMTTEEKKRPPLESQRRTYLRLSRSGERSSGES